MLHYQIRAGKAAAAAPTHMLLHGFLGSGRNLTSLARRWCEAAPREGLVLVDLRGHGSSPGLPDDGGDLRLLAQDVLDLAESLGIRGPVSMVGHSLGGRVALKARFLAPERVGDIVLLDISPSPTVGRSEGLDQILDVLMQAPSRHPEREYFRNFFLERGVSKPLTEWLLLNLRKTDEGLQWQIDCERLKKLHARASREDLWAAVELPGVRTRCILGGRSAFVGPVDAQRMREANVRVQTIPDATHFIHADSLTELVALLVEA